MEEKKKIEEPRGRTSAMHRLDPGSTEQNFMLKL